MTTHVFELGKNVIGTLDDITGEFIISGNGETNNYDDINLRPFESFIPIIKKLEIKNGITTLGNGIFKSLTSITGDLIIPDSVTIIGKEVFNGCIKLNGKLQLSNNLITIGDRAFSNCEALIGDLNIPNSVTTIGAYCFYKCQNINGVLTLPNKLTVIPNNCFYKCQNITGELIIPNSVEIIGNNAFYSCKGFVGTILIPKTVKTFENSSFKFCSGIDKIMNLSSTNQTVEANSFDSLKASVVIESYSSNSNFKTHIDTLGYTWKEITRQVVQLGENVVGEFNSTTGHLVVKGTGPTYDYSFSTQKERPIQPFYLDLKSLEIQDGVTQIGGYLFAECSNFRGNLVLPNTVTTINDYAFSGAGFDGTLTLSNNLKNLYTGCFRDCINFIGDLTIPDKTKTISMQSFYGCRGFNGTLTIPSSTSTISINSFYYCSGIKTIINRYVGVQTVSENAFMGITGVLVKGYSTNTSFKSHIEKFKYKWEELIDVFKLGENVTCAIDMSKRKLTLSGNGPTYDYTSVNYETRPFQRFVSRITNLEIQNGITKLGDYLFSSCQYIEGELILPNSITEIGVDTFNACYGITGNLILNENISIIGDGAFKYCDCISGDLVLPSSLLYIGHSAFIYCSSIKTIINNRKEDQTVIVYAFDGLNKGVLVKGYSSNITFKSAITYNKYTWEELAPVSLPIFLGTKPITKIYKGSSLIKEHKIVSVAKKPLHKLFAYQNSIMYELDIDTYEPLSVSFNLPTPKAKNTRIIEGSTVHIVEDNMEYLFVVDYVSKTTTKIQLGNEHNIILTAKTPIGKICSRSLNGVKYIYIQSENKLYKLDTNLNIISEKEFPIGKCTSIKWIEN